MAYRIKNHRLVDAATGSAVPFRQTPNRNAGTIAPTVLVAHDTAGRLDHQTSVSWLCDKAAKASAHFVVGRNPGETVQLCPTNVATWHAGASSYKGRPNVNGFSVGIELVNPGKMTGDAGVARTWFGQTFTTIANGIVHRSTPEHGAGWWMPYTEHQIDEFLAIGLALREAYGITDVTAHWAISPGRKVDTNPLFPLDSVRSRILGRADAPADDGGSPPAAQTVADVNQRRWPSFSDNVIQVVPRGSRVEIIRVGEFVNDGDRARWALARFGGHEGWIHSAYLDD